MVRYVFIFITHFVLFYFVLFHCYYIVCSPRYISYCMGDVCRTGAVYYGVLYTPESKFLSIFCFLFFVFCFFFVSFCCVRRCICRRSLSAINCFLLGESTRRDESKMPSSFGCWQRVDPLRKETKTNYNKKIKMSFPDETVNENLSVNARTIQILFFLLSSLRHESRCVPTGICVTHSLNHKQQHSVSWSSDTRNAYNHGALYRGLIVILCATFFRCLK